MTGVIYRLIHAKGYGFIRDENEDERFMHVSDLVESDRFIHLREGQRVQFEPTEREGRGLGVRKVQCLNG